MEKKQPSLTATKIAAPTRAQIKNRIVKGFFVSLFTALVPSGGSGVGNAEEMKTATTAVKKKPGYNVKGGSRAVAAAVLTPASSCSSAAPCSDPGFVRFSAQPVIPIR